MKKNVTRLALLGLAATLLFTLGACSKYKGFKKSDSGIYYKFYGDIHDTAAQPEYGGYVAMLLSMRAGDSVLIPMRPVEMPVESLYVGDVFEAICMMHVGDSATFILDGPLFYQNMKNDEDYPFGDDPLYFDIKLIDLMTKAQIDELKAEFEAQLKEREGKEEGEINEYLKNHPGMKQCRWGIYSKTVKKGNGAKVEPLQTVKVHYTGRFVDGTVFDSSVDRGTPFTFTVGAGEVIPGWDATVSEMNVGDKVTVLIPSDMAYGEGTQAIPPYTPLEFDIELLEIVNE